MSISLTVAQKEVIRKIIYAVETGGQVYGNVRYDNFTEAYTNSSIEHAITIGGGQWYATEAQILLKLIRSTNSTLFSQLDTARIGIDLDTQNWSTYKLSKSSAKAKCIQKIISSSVGKKCQDTLIDEQMQKYIDEAAELGVTDIDALMMCANFRHQGGLGAMKRVLGKTQKPYTLDNLYAACQTDTGNQVGAYKSRQKMVYNSLKKYLSTSATNNMEVNRMGVTASQIIKIMSGWVGKSRANGTHRDIIDLYNSHTPRARGYKVTYSDAYCDTTVSAAFIKAGNVDIIGGTECGVQNHITLFKNAGIWEEDGTITPKPGYIICFNWDDGTQPNDGYADHIGIVESVKNGKITCIEGNMSGGIVGRRTINVGWGYIRGYAKPKYDAESSSKPTTTPSAPATSTNSELSKAIKWNGVVTADKLNVRTWAGTNNKTCSFSPLEKNTKVGVCDSVKASDGSTWYYIKYNNKYGFVHSNYIKKETASTTQSTSSNKIDYAQSNNSAFSGTYRTTANLNLRKGAGTNKGIILTIPKGDKVICYGNYTKVNGTNWYLVQYGSLTGFVSSKYLKK